MKQRFSSLDVKVIAHELNNSLSSLRVANIYDLSSRIFLLKCAKPGHREQLLVDSGFRCHLTSFSRTAASAPSAFVTRLRKYLKSRRITNVSQIGTDRVIEITFSDGTYRLYLEFFAAGNIILTDAELNVLALLRQVSEGNEDVDVKLGGKYVLEAKQNFHGIPPISDERVRTSLETQIEKVKAAAEIGGKKAKRHKGGDELRKALGVGFPEYPPHLLDHAFTETGLEPSTKPEEVLASSDLMKKLIAALEQAQEIFGSFANSSTSKGFIIAKHRESTTSQTESNESTLSQRDTLLYDDFHPFRPAQLVNKPGTEVLEFDGFNRTVDEFYSSIESQKLESRLTEREEAAKKKLETAKNEHEKRLGALQQQQEMHIRKAQTIEANTHRVEEAAAAVNGLIGQGMDWQDIGKLIGNEQGRGNVVAQMIKLPLKLYENSVTLLLDEPYVEEESDEEDADVTDEESDDEAQGSKKTTVDGRGDKRLTIDIDLALSSWANARQYYEQKKTAAVKEQKTVQASARALKSTEKKIETDLKKGLKQEKAALRPARKQLWFEKFLYFISSDGYLVIGGKDAQQNELLYRRYLKKGDVYVHADLQGASSVIVKNNPTTPDAPIPPSTLSHAGALTVCTSSAWDSKAVMAAWWVNSDQVSKTAPTGEYLTTGGFMIRGKKNFLPPSQLLLGFGVLWLISEDSRANHGKHRLMRTESMVSGEAEALADEAKGLRIDEEVGEEPENEVAGSHADVEEDADEDVSDVHEEVHLGEDNEEQERDEDTVSLVHSVDERQHRSNPLQMNGSTHPKEPASVDSDDGQDGVESDGAPEIAGYSGGVRGAGIDVEEAGEHEAEDDDNESENEDNSHAADTNIHDHTTATKQTDDKQSSKQKPQQLSRGKRGKLKRAAQKYANQDETDRELAMQLLGSTRAQEKKATAEADKAARDAKAHADKERRRAQHAKFAEAEKAKQERLAKGEQNADRGDGDVEEIDNEQLEQERKEHMDIDLLVPTPEPGDEIVAAIPVVAPWGALGRCKYKVKLQPGGMKKGKAVKEIVGHWAGLGAKGSKVVDEQNRDKEKVWAREVECVKMWRVEEVVGVVPVKGCRIVQSGGTAGASGAAGGKGKGGGAARGGKGSKKGR